MIQTILVTGGAGFIGSNFIRYYLKKYPNKRVINLDKLTYCGNLNNLKDIEDNPNYEFIQGDICDEEIVSNIIKKVDGVIHFAAESHVDKSIKNPFVFTKTNVFGTHVLLEAAKNAKIKKFLHISTDEVYGSIPLGSFKETDNLNPSSPYSASKAAAEFIVKGFHTTFGLPTTIVRCSNTFGPYQYPEKVIPLFVTNLIQNKKIPLYGDGRNRRTWIYVLDVCEAVDFIFKHGLNGEVYNIAGIHELENIDLTKKILSLLGKDMSYIKYVEDRLAHDKRYSTDGLKLQELGWTPNISFDTVLKETVQWYIKNSDWWNKLKESVGSSEEN